MSANDRKTGLEWWKSAAGLWTAGTICVVLLLPVVFFFPGKEPPAAKPLSAQTAAAAPTALVSARLDTDTFEQWQIETLRITVLNRGKDTLTGLNMQVLAPGFELEPPSLDACTFAAGTPGVRELKPNQACSVAVPLKAIAASGSYSIAVKAGWFQGQPENTLLTLGSAHMRDGFGRMRWARFGERLAQVTKDLTFPLLLLLLTTLLGRWQKDRETRQAKRERKHIEKTADQDRKLSERAQVRQLLLNKVTEMAEKYYLKISSAGKGILDARSDLASGKETSTDRMFYNAMLLVWHMTALKDERGGMFFQNRQAEEIVSKAWSILKPTLFAVVSEDQIAAALSLLGKDSGFVAFKKSVRFMAVGSARFAHWYSGDDADILEKYGKLNEFVPVIDALQAIFHYETNAPLNEYWYEESRGLRYSSAAFTLPKQERMTESQRQAATTLPDLFALYLEKTRESKEKAN